MSEDNSRYLWLWQLCHWTLNIEFKTVLDLHIWLQNDFFDSTLALEDLFQVSEDQIVCLPAELEKESDVCERGPSSI